MKRSAAFHFLQKVLLAAESHYLERITPASAAFRHAASCLSPVEMHAARAQARATCSKRIIAVRTMVLYAASGIARFVY